MECRGGRAKKAWMIPIHVLKALPQAPNSQISHTHAMHRRSPMLGNTILVNVVDFQDNPNSKRYLTNKMQGGDASRALADAKIGKNAGM